MNSKDLPDRWQSRLKGYLSTKKNYGQNLGAEDFPSNKILRLTFPDGSVVQFNYAMILKAPELNEVAVFTEHCGYHIFPSYDLHIEEVTPSYSLRAQAVIDYPPEAIQDFQGYLYEWVDNLNFALDPKELLENPEPYLKVAKEKFLKAGWQGDGDIQLMWIPPFAQQADELESYDDFYNGVTVWHVKQFQDGFSWILSPKELPFA